MTFFGTRETFASSSSLKEGYQSHTRDEEHEEYHIASTQDHCWLFSVFRLQLRSFVLQPSTAAPALRLFFQSKRTR